MRSALLAGLAALLLSATSWPAAAAPEVARTRLQGPSFDHRESVSGGRAEVEVRMDRGKLVVRGVAGGGARATGKLGGDVAGLDVERQGHWLRYVVAPKDGPPGLPLELASELTLELPPGSDLVVEGPAVEVRIEGLSGALDVRTLNGPVHLAGKPSKVEVQTISGGITTADFECPWTILRSVTGVLELGGRFEELTARTADSLLRVTASISDEARLESAHGEVRFEGELGPVAKLHVQTMGGEARLLLARELEGHFSVSSFQGQLDNELGPAWGREGLRRLSTWQKGKAARRVEVESFDGKISLLPR